MDYKVKEISGFSIIGQEIQITNRQLQNIRICKEFWQKFNISIKDQYLFQQGNWMKYAFTYKRNNNCFYCCAIPESHHISDGFIKKEVKGQKYIVFEHIGDMNSIYMTYNIIYKEIIPSSGYIVNKEEFFHFEKYDYRFHWNRADSIIEIWVPIQECRL